MVKTSGSSLIPGPALLLSCSLAAGIILGRWRMADPFVLAALVILCGAVIYKSQTALRVIFLIGLIAGVGLIHVHDYRSSSETTLSRLMPIKKAVVIAEISAVDSVRFINTRYLLKVISVNDVKANGYVRWYKLNKLKLATLLPGDVLKFTNAKLKQPRSLRNIGAWDYERYMCDRRIEGTLLTVKKSSITIIGREYNWRRKLEAVKAGLRENLTFENIKITAISRAMLIGDQGLVTPEDRDTFSRAGTAHLLAVSGLHIGFIATVGYFIIKALAFALIYPLRYSWASAAYPARIAAVGALCLVILYAALTGPRISSARAAIMVGVYLLALFSGRPKDFYGAFSVALGLILVFMPWSIFEAGFQLSFSAVLAIVIFMERFWKPVFENTHEREFDKPLPHTLLKRFPLLASGAAISLFASIGTAPLVAYHFNVVPSYGVFLNTLLVPLSSVAVPWGLVSSFGFSDWALIVTEKMMNVIWLATDWAAGLPFAYRHTASIPPAAVVFYYLLIGSLIFFEPGRTRRFAIGIMIPVLAITLAYRPVLSALDQRLTIHFIDVGQGDSIAVTWPQGGAMVIDGGRKFTTFDMGRSIVAPLLWRAQRTTLLAIIATHSDSDHIGGLAGLADRVPPAIMFDHGALERKAGPYLALRNKAQKNGRYNVLKSGDIFKFPGGLTMNVLNPPDESPLPYSNKRNNRSIVIKLIYKNVRVLLTADISKKTEQWLIDSGADIKADVLKIAHHGSYTSSSNAFLKAVGAKTAVISAGFQNRFRHPDAKVLKRLDDAGMKIYRTDLDGEIIMKTDGDTIQWSSFSGLIGPSF